jgi:hypothetical protein
LANFHCSPHKNAGEKQLAMKDACLFIQGQLNLQTSDVIFVSSKLFGVTMHLKVNDPFGIEILPPLT